jgi:hypothetical protein
MASNRPSLYRSGVGYPSQLPPKIWAQKELNISKKWPKSSITSLNQLKIKKHYNKTHFLFNIGLKRPTMDAHTQLSVTWHLGGQAPTQRAVRWPLSPKD